MSRNNTGQDRSLIRYDHEFDMDAAGRAVAAALAEVTGDVVPVRVEMTGGGSAAMFVGDPVEPTLVAGPGTFGWGGGPSVGSSLEFHVGADPWTYGDEVAADLCVVMPAGHEDPVRWCVQQAVKMWPRALAAVPDPRPR